MYFHIKKIKSQTKKCLQGIDFFYSSSILIFMEKETPLKTKDIMTPLWIIAISAASVVLFIVASVLWSLVYPEGEDIRAKHLDQHQEEQVKYDQMIEILEEIEENTERNSNQN